MSYTSLLLVFVSLTFTAAFGDSCGGLLESEYGNFSLPLDSKPNESETSGSSCLWIIQLHYKANIRFTLNNLNYHSHLNLYPEDQLTACTASNYTKLNVSHIGSSFEFPGKTLIVILPNASSLTAFSWEANDKDNNGVGIMKHSDFVSSPHGLLEWRQLEPEERATWAINPSAPVSINWNLDMTTSCNASDNCACLYFAIFQLTSEGVLSEAVRTCGRSSEGKLEGVNGSFLVLIKVNTKVESNKAAVSWVVDAPVTPVPSGGLFAATTAGLIALNLRTLEATNLTSELTLAVAANHNLNKVYWSEIGDNSRIMRSNFDGSAKEVIVAGTGDNIYMLGIDETSGSVYYGLHKSNRITVCNALGGNCTGIISSSALVSWPWGIDLDSENGVMYWGKRMPGAHALMRAGLDGDNATTISTGFTDLCGITLTRPTNGTIYWVDYGKNTIGTIDVNGGNRQTLVELGGNPALTGIQVDAHKIYCSNLASGTIQSVDKDSGDHLTTISNSTGGVRHLAIFNAPEHKI